MTNATITARLHPVNAVLAQGKSLELLNSVKAKMGTIPNMMKTMAQSPAVLEGYLAFSGVLSRGLLSAQIREKIAVYVSQANGCEYCLSAHTLIARRAGAKPAEVQAARQGLSEEPRTQAILTLVRDILDNLGDVSDEQLADAREAGLSDAEIAEVVGHVALSTFTNYFNQLAHTEVDFPRVSVEL